MFFCNLFLQSIKVISVFVFLDTSFCQYKYTEIDLFRVIFLNYK
jgi:hypothetical protein